jgi:menaquinone-dependent protoporphyrinogen oxidase
MPSAFFSVSGSAGSREARGKIDAQRCIDDFLRETGWRPILTESIAGAMAFTKYNPIVRWVLKQISKRNGGPTDTSHDHELTDWTEVEQFAGAFMTMVNGGAAAGVL